MWKHIIVRVNMLVEDLNKIKYFSTIAGTLIGSCNLKVNHR
jgi:hypothetical protein